MDPLEHTVIPATISGEPRRRRGVDRRHAPGDAHTRARQTYGRTGWLNGSESGSSSLPPSLPLPGQREQASHQLGMEWCGV